MNEQQQSEASALAQIAEYENKIQALKIAALDELRGKEKEILNSLAAIRARIAEVEGEARPSAKASRAASYAPRETRARVSDEDLLATFRTVLATRPDGVSKGDLCQAAGIGKPRFDVFVRRNPGSFKTTGNRAGLRYFLP
jgi:hypothetical protein